MFFFSMANTKFLILEIILKSMKVLQTERNLGFEPDEETIENQELMHVNNKFCSLSLNEYFVLIG